MPTKREGKLVITEDMIHSEMQAILYKAPYPSRKRDELLRQLKRNLKEANEDWGRYHGSGIGPGTADQDGRRSEAAEKYKLLAGVLKKDGKKEKAEVYSKRAKKLEAQYKKYGNSPEYLTARPGYGGV